MVEISLKQSYKTIQQSIKSFQFASEDNNDGRGRQSGRQPASQGSFKHSDAHRDCEILEESTLLMYTSDEVSLTTWKAKIEEARSDEVKITGSPRRAEESDDPNEERKD